jgi:hypothetical protein
MVYPGGYSVFCTVVSGADLGIWEGGFNTWKVMIIVTDLRAPTSAYGATSQRGVREFFYIKVPICDFLASKMVKVKPATVGKLGIFL